ncbi:Apl1p KNAG_0H02390 [Huiozyma naganishii CBS 8797]|uniref:AP complex subunit beta n=1 Tax=Huiozyma naganishii (strain ATCC MYA-139 / BCRC 22969 / CBS 8797 / KCTC 17520 / NBRC 10181 / NCYC 3082 / Yp74L-3) TaxID=1071383 RepID=J7S8N3_HUIN7|nr:hypothetical protein KNAG_0H02390 [Kazachstania naganishii CBS 8797]CCK71654.1 hypothetical protein KNAG_0H02390 [Kazachstania naganishii CBS 8797]
MSDQRIFARYKASEIRTDLQTIDVKKIKSSVTKRKHALRKIIANLTLGNYVEMVVLFPDILKFWQIEDDLEVKRICHEYVRTIGALKPRFVIDAMPSIRNDLRSNNEQLQIMALETLVGIPFFKFTDEAFNFIMTMINKRSSSPALMKSAVYSLLQLDEWDHERVMTLLGVLHGIFEDHVGLPTVQVAALKTLYTLHDKTKNLKPLHISVDTALDLLGLIPQLNEWDVSNLLECLVTVVVPQTHDDSYDMIDIVLPQLQHVNTSVALKSLEFIVYLLNYVDEISETVVDRLSNSILTLLEKPPELQFLILRNIILLLLTREKPVVKLEVSYFFVEYNDPIYIKDTKLECLYLLANSNTLPQILDELEQYSTDIDIQMSRKAVRAIGNLAVKLGAEAAETCVDVLMNLLEFGVDYVVQEIISVFRNILRRYPDRFQSDVRAIVEYIDCAQVAESKNAMIWIICNYSHLLPNYIELFEVFCSNIKSETLDVQFSILNSAIKFFVRDPSPRLENMCLRLFNFLTEDVNNPDLRSRAFLYWRLLSISKERVDILTPEVLKEIVDGELPVIELNTKLDQNVLEELELNIGTVTSVYLKPTGQIFHTAKTKHLKDSPVLNSEKGHLKIIKQDENEGPKYETTLENKGVIRQKLQRNSTMNDYDRPAEKVNELKGKRKSSTNNASKLARKPSLLMRKFSLKKKF